MVNKYGQSRHSIASSISGQHLVAIMLDFFQGTRYRLFSLGKAL